MDATKSIVIAGSNPATLPYLLMKSYNNKMMYTEKDWHNKIEEWKQTYGTSKRVSHNSQPNPTRVSLRYCYRCGKNKQRMARHHIRSDFFFACLLPDVYAKKYIEFRKVDIVWLCNECHELAHRRYRSIIRRFWDEVNRHHDGIPNKSVCDEYRKKIEKVFRTWIKNYREKNAKKNGKTNRC